MWRASMLVRIGKETMRNQKRHRISVSAAHEMAIQNYRNKILSIGVPAMYQLYSEMMQDEFPKQREMLCKITHGDNYKTAYAQINNQNEMLEIIKSERATSGTISSLEKMFIDKVLHVLPTIGTIKDINEQIPHILTGTTEMGLPLTAEELYSYLKEKLSIKY